jgi:hypothetical protein
MSIYKGKKRKNLDLRTDEGDEIQIRFGTVAVKKGFVTFEQVTEAMSIQVGEDIENRQHRMIGKILLDQRLMIQPQIDEVIYTIEKEDLPEILDYQIYQTQLRNTWK